MDPRQVQNASDPPNQMIFRNRLVEPELVEKLPLLPIEPPHHGPPPPPIRTTVTESLFAVTFNGVLQHYRHIATFRGDAAIQSLSERSGHPASRAYQNRIY